MTSLTTADTIRTEESLVKIRSQRASSYGFEAKECHGTQLMLAQLNYPVFLRRVVKVQFHDWQRGQPLTSDIDQ